MYDCIKVYVMFLSYFERRSLNELFSLENKLILVSRGNVHSGHGNQNLRESAST